jgi:adenylate cyclase
VVTFRRQASHWFAHLSPEWQVRLALGSGLTVSNLVGVGVVAVLCLFVVPLPQPPAVSDARVQSVQLGLAFAVLGGVIGSYHAWRTLHPVVVMLRPSESAGTISDRQRRHVLKAPRRIFLFQLFLWVWAAVILAAVNWRASLTLGVSLGLIVALAGSATSCVTYLLSERSLRPVARRVLATGIPARRWVPSVRNRAMFAWWLGTGVSVLGIILLGVGALIEPEDISLDQLAVTIVVVGALAMAIGLLSSYAAAEASSEPIRTLREAVERVDHGDLEVEVPIYDSTEIGLLQAGFNQMVQGLREREHLRDLFGRHVGEDVARAALERGIELGGEEREVAVLFVDVIGSTSLAENCPPAEVVELLNRFFAVVIDVVHEHEGFVNKFEGDAALAIWGAPVESQDLHTCTLKAARTMQRRLAEEVPELRASIGVSTGRAVAGNVGTPERYEYTVIGDPVNEAARLTTAAKQTDRLVLVNCALVAGATAEEARHWEERDPITVRGRSEPTRVAAPRD